MPSKYHAGLGFVLAYLLLAAPQASACAWWECGDRAYRPPARAYGYRSPTRAYGYAYIARPSTAIPSTRSYLATAIPVPNAGAVGLTAPIATADGLLEGGLPGRGPTLFGPQYPSGYGYYPGYSTSGPLPPTSWVERRRRR